MFKVARALCIVSVLLISCTTAFADIAVTGTAGDGWQSWTIGSTTPYWASTTSGEGVNVGQCLVGSPNCAMADSAPGNLKYWGASNGAADSSFYFSNVPLGATDAGTMEIELAGNKLYNRFGWYEVTSNGGIGSMHSLFVGASAQSATAQFTPTGSYGFYFSGCSNDACTGGTTWYTQSAGEQHFAVFQQDASTLWLGMEDLPFSGSDKDYQDMIVKISRGGQGTIVPTPEPGAILSLVVMLGAVGLGWRARRVAA
jgi:hypothetical protein